MIEVLWHGRGGQGAFTAARLLGAAASMDEGKYALAFPSFGPERRGAPMRAFTKMDAKKVGDRSEIALADFVVYLDETLFLPGWESELKEGGKVLVNSAKAFDDPRVIALDANGISLKLLGREIPNTTFLAALSVLSDALTTENVQEAIRQYMPAKLHGGNLAIVEEVVALMAHETSEVSGSLAEKEEAETEGVEVEDAPVGEQPCQAITGQQRRGGNICRLVDDELDPFEFARTTTWAAGHLVTKNAGWRVYRPVLDSEKCTGCLQCYLQCPDGTVYKVHADDDAQTAPIAIDYDFCKGCGICVRACKFEALTMIAEGKVR